MANISDKTEETTSKNGEMTTHKSRKATVSIQDCCDFLKRSDKFDSPSFGLSPYKQIIDMMSRLDIQDDGILMNRKIKEIAVFFCSVIHDERMLCESMEYINDRALDDHDTSIKFAILLASHDFDSLAMNETKIRYAMINILETNFNNSDLYRESDKNRFYNSITLLGEYHHRLHLHNNSPFKILCKSLLKLLIKELEDVQCINVRLAKLILSQVTLNGTNMRTKHKEDLATLLFHLRRILIEKPNLKEKVKALLMMTLDLFYSNFTNLGKELEEMYTKYLIEETSVDENDTENNNCHDFEKLCVSSKEENQIVNRGESTFLNQEKCDVHHSEKEDIYCEKNKDLMLDTNKVHSSEKIDFDISINDSIESDNLPLKKWSEETLEDTLFEDELLNSSFDSHSNGNDNEIYESEKYNFEKVYHNSRESYKPGTLPRHSKTKSSCNERNSTSGFSHKDLNVEDRNESKSLPRWRATRFNSRECNENTKQGRLLNQRRFHSFVNDDPKCGQDNTPSIRLYSVNDRLKHVQEKFDRKSSNNFNIVNWAGQSQRDDRSERSYLSNYERGNSKKGSRHYNRQIIDKPPRFQKKQFERNLSPSSNRETKIHSESWRRSNNTLCNDFLNDENPSQSKTLPRTRKNKFDYQKRGKNEVRHNQNENEYLEGSSHIVPQKHYGSQNSIISDTSNKFERNRQKSRYRDYKNRSSNWDDDRSAQRAHTDSNDWMEKNDIELVRNAQQTTKYMNYLSSKK